MYRNTYVEVNLPNLEYNVKTLINRYSGYKYFFGVVKADCYGHNGLPTIKTIINAGCNYLATATLDLVRARLQSFMKRKAMQMAVGLEFQCMDW